VELKRESVCNVNVMTECRLSVTINWGCLCNLLCKVRFSWCVCGNQSRL